MHNIFLISVIINSVLMLIRIILTFYAAYHNRSIDI